MKIFKVEAIRLNRKLERRVFTAVIFERLQILQRTVDKTMTPRNINQYANSDIDVAGSDHPTKMCNEGRGQEYLKGKLDCGIETPGLKGCSNTETRCIKQNN